LDVALFQRRNWSRPGERAVSRRPPAYPPGRARAGIQVRPAVGAETGVAELAADIGRLRRRLTRRDLLNHPRISAELEELDQVVAAGLDHRRGRGRHRLPAGTAAVRDVTGYDIKPDPLTARTGAELVDVLRKYRQWAGNTPFRAMASRARWEVAHSTMCVALKSDTLPALKVVVAIVAGCGGGDDDRQAFATAWRRISFGAAGTQGLRPVRPATGTDS
jgi:hypothetical protein